MIKIQISKTLQGKIRKGYPWVFNYQIQNRIPDGSRENLGVIYDHNNRFLAMGLWDPYSDLCFRVLNLGKPREINGYFFLERLQSAIKIRQELETQGTTGYRVINGESDGFPGLVLDRYEDTLVLKLYTTSWFPFLDDLCIISKRIQESAGGFAISPERWQIIGVWFDLSGWADFVWAGEFGMGAI